MPAPVVEWRDLLQLGFSFAVAVYLLVRWTKLSEGLLVLLQSQGEELKVMGATLRKLEDLLSWLAHRDSPARGKGGD